MNPFGQKFDGKNCYFGADFHINHKNLVRGTSTWTDKAGTRDFQTIEEMNETIIQNITRVIPEDGILFNLGDIIFGKDSKQTLRTLLDRLKPRRHIYLHGNHSTFIRKDLEAQSWFDWVGDYLEVYIGGQMVIMQHYCPKVWNKSHHNSIALWGHSHGTLPDDPNSKSMDVGMDTTYPQYGIEKNFEPYSWTDIKKIMHQKVWTKIDHHGPETN